MLGSVLVEAGVGRFQANCDATYGGPAAVLLGEKSDESGLECHRLELEHLDNNLGPCHNGYSRGLPPYLG